MPRTLIFGGTGMLGRALVAEGRGRRWPVLGLDLVHGDINDSQAVRYWVKSFRPELVINCAAFTNVDACEERQEEAFAANGSAVGNLAAVAEEVGAALLQISTDYVFDGQAAQPYAEEAATGPRSIYGKSKLEGERQALRYPGSLVLRTSWLFGPGGPNFPLAMLRLMERGQRQLRVVRDQVGGPTYTPFLARAIWDLADLGVTGVLHYRNRPAVSWHEFACEIARLWDPAVEVVPVTTEEFPRPAPRPAYSVLEVSRCERVLGRPVESWIWGLEEYLSGLRAARSAEGLRGL